MTELGADGGFRGCPVVTLVEQQVERAVNGRKSRRELGWRGDIEQPLRRREQFLRPRYPFLNCGVAADEGARDLVYAEAPQDVENERNLCLLGQARLAAGEHHAKEVVLDRVRRKELFDGGGECPLAVQQASQLRREGSRRALAPQNVECPVLRGRQQPCGRVVRHTTEFPHLQRAAEGVLHDVFCQREVVHAEHPGERGDHAPRLAPEQMIAGLHHISRTRIGRTSTDPPTSKIGQPFEISTACARSRASIKVKPLTMSLASAKGPSWTLFCLPLTTLPVRSSGCPGYLMWPFAPSSLNQASHFCMDFCISSGDCAVGSLPRNRKVNSLIVCPLGLEHRTLDV